MGAWSESVFGNDDAADFLFEIEDAGSTGEVITVLEDGLNAVAGEDGYVYAPEGAVGLAAAALAISWGHPAVLDDATSQSLGEPWPRTSEALPDRLLAKAAAVLDRMRRPDANELADLWNDADKQADFDSELSRWRAHLP
ncbi:DUF4259 domain-containing protein [Arthrobacter celericrescens]|uniref:DUF4259 domain-containing protein n=1 Tax=Arthrobacter celericrescens TaxID=2320851 RepID=UPI000EA19A7C|nr:DUF4259 domain-containing protein [Arthrobacter celericrescens]